MESNKVDDRISCPYNSEHKLRPDRLVWHLIKCESKESAKLTTARCPFDTTHILPIEEIIEHVKNDCTSKPSEKIIESLQRGYDDWNKLVEAKTNGKQQDNRAQKEFHNGKNSRQPKKYFKKVEDTKTDPHQTAKEETKANGFNKTDQLTQSSRSKSVKTYKKVADSDASTKTRGRPEMAQSRKEKQAVSQERPITIVSEALPDMGDFKVRRVKKVIQSEETKVPKETKKENETKKEKVARETKKRNETKKEKVTKVTKKENEAKDDKEEKKECSSTIF